MLKNSSSALLLTLLYCIQISSGQDVILKYDLYPKNRTQGACLPRTHWNLLTSFSFNDQSPLPNLVLTNETIRSGAELRVSCMSSQPLQWILDVPDVSISKLSNFYLHPRDTESMAGNPYYICIGFDDLTSLSGSLRCESMLDATLGAEIFIQNEGIKPHLGNCSADKTVKFLVVNGSENIVPCKIRGGIGDKSAFEVQVIENPAHSETDNVTVSNRGPPLCSRLNYDPRLGCCLDTPINPNSTYQCRNTDDWTDCVDLTAISERDGRIHAKIEYMDHIEESERQERGIILGEIRCSVENTTRGNIHLRLDMLPCNKLPSCLRRDVAGFRVPYPERNITRYSSGDGPVINTALLQSGLVHCHGCSVEDYGKNYVQEFGYFFKGLNGHGYLISQGFPLEAVIQLEEKLAKRKSGFKYSFKCTISTFILFRAFNITLEFSPGKSRHFHVHSNPNRYEELAEGNYSISGVMKVPYHPRSEIWINVSSTELTSVSCSAAYTYKLGWASARYPVDSTTTKTSATTTTAVPTKVSTTTAVPTTASTATAVPTMALTTTEVLTRTLPLATVTVTVMSKTELIATAVPLAILAVLAILIAALLFLKYRRNEAFNQGLTAEEIEQFRFGNIESAGVANSTINLVTLNSEGLLDVDTLAFPPHFQIAWNQLAIYRNDLLGEGECAFCFRGKFKGTVVAVKMLKPSVEVEDFKNYLKEVKLMASIGQHPNVIGFYGAVIEKLDQKILPVVLELSPHGNLKKFLQESGNLILAGDGERVLVSFCAQIASGMEYLSHRNVIHGDLAARNVLVFEGLTVKITDFGLSKNLYESSQYSRRHQHVRLPWRWMAPESLESLTFSVQSDVWSFGVVAWEIFTLGQVPFTEHAWTTEFMRQLRQDGLRLPKPARATDKIFEFLNLCWNIEPAYRPAFSDTKKFFLCLLQDEHYDLAPCH